MTEFRFLIFALLALSGCATAPEENCEPAHRGPGNWRLTSPPNADETILETANAPRISRYFWYTNDNGDLRACVRESECGTTVYEFKKAGSSWVGELAILTVCHN